MAKSNFFEKISCSTQESQVQETYNEMFKSVFKINTIDRKCQCDGYIDTRFDDTDISMLIEYKYDIRMKDKIERARVIAQCVGYLHKFEESGMALPKLVFIGDINECCIIHTNDLIKFLDIDCVNWDIAPCNLCQENNLIMPIVKSINPWVYDVNEDFKFQDVADKIVDLCSNVNRKIHITEKNIEKVYNLFCDRVLKDKKKVQANDLVSTFIGVMLDQEHYYQHPKKKNILVANDKQVAINGDEFELFMQMHSTEYSPKEKRIMTAISDRLIDDTNRRNKGEFYTPTLFVDYAHEMIEKELGSHWKDNYVVWDCCCGTKNLTRDYRFKELYCSTLEQAELDISKNYNKEATSFQFDFLNDSLDDLKVKAPGLLESLELNKPICFFINPPYMSTSPNNNGGAGKTFNRVNNIMKKDNIGLCAREMYAQFLYRILTIKTQYNLTNCYIALFCRPTFLAKDGFIKFRQKLLTNFKYINGYIADSRFFGGTGSWALSFNLWGQGETKDKTNFIHKIIDFSNETAKEIGIKNIYNSDNSISLSDWKKDKEKRDIEYPNFRELMKSDENGKMKFSKNSIGTYFSGMNMFHGCSMCYYHGGDNVITYDNFSKITIADVVYHNGNKSWVNSWDYPLVGKSNNTFENDSIIYFLFSGRNYDWALRQIQYHDKLWDIKNEFFWMSKQEMIDLAEEYNNDYTYEDALNSEERFVYLKLQEIKNDLSPEAKAVLDKATYLVKKSFKYREMFNESHPEYQINNWDCGFYQIKALLKEFMPDDLKEFRALYKQLADKMRPQVYELGFLK